LSKKNEPKPGSNLEEIRLLPKEIDFNGDIFIYKNKVVLSSIEGKHTAVIVESEPIAKMMEVAFDLLWEKNG
jgi:hypothetical protein